MKYGKKNYSKRGNAPVKGFSSKSVSGVSKTSRDYRFKQINQHKIKPEPFPRVMYTRMKYGYETNLNLAADSLADGIAYSVNSIWKPMATFPSRSTVGLSTMSGIYNKYLVTGCKVYLSFNNPQKDGLRVGYRIRMNTQNAANGNTMQDIAEKPMTYVSGLNDTGSQKKAFSFFIRPWSLIGVSKLEYMANTTKYSSDIFNVPNEQGFFDVFAIDPVAQTNTVDFMLRIVYYVQLYDRVGLQSSPPPA